MNIQNSIEPLKFDSFFVACKHFNINLGLFIEETLEAEINAYQELGTFLCKNNLGCHFNLDGSFEIIRNPNTKN